MTNDETLRLEALKVACATYAEYTADDVVEAAEVYYGFLRGLTRAPKVQAAE